MCALACDIIKMISYHVNAFCVPPEVPAPLARGNCCTQVIVVMLMKGVEGLGIRITNEVIQVLGLCESRMLGTRRCVMMGWEWGWEVRWLKIGSCWQGGTAMMWHTTPIAIASMSMMMSTRVGRRVSTAQRGNATMAR